MSKFSKVMGGLLMLAVATGVSADTKIGVFSFERIIQQAAPAQKADRKIKDEFSKKQGELQRLEQQVKELGADLEKNEATMSEADRNKKQNTLRDLNTKFQRLQREFREDLSARRNEETGKLNELLIRAVKQLAEAERYDLIVQGDELPYVNPRVDVTDKLLKLLSDK